MQAEFGTAPEDVLGAGRPFVVAQIPQLRFIQARCEYFAQLVDGLRRARNGRNTCAIGPSIAMCEIAGKPWIALLEPGAKAFEL